MDASGWIAYVRKNVDERLSSFFAEKRREIGVISPDSQILVEGVEALTMRGGKRLRPAVLAAAHRAVAPEGEAPSFVDAAAALELLQSYLLIHDDWMDCDDERRGGPSVHADFRMRIGEPHLANALAILAGDLASTYAWELFLEAPWPEARRRDAERAFLVLHKEVYCGQHLDLTGSRDVARMHQLKTGSYTVRGPLLLGALLGNAGAAHLEALERLGEPLGEAFQLRDDILGTFGETKTTGKPSGNDLRAGKRTSLVAAAERLVPRERREALDVVLGQADASDDHVTAAARLLVDSGALREVEERLADLLGLARRAIDEAPLGEEGKALLRGVAEMLAVRTH